MAIPFADPHDDPYLLGIVDLIRDAMGSTPSHGCLFGSRAAGRAQPGSDYDMAVQSDRSLDDALFRARLALEESTIPFTVDLVNLVLADQASRARVMEEGVRLW